MIITNIIAERKIVIRKTHYVLESRARVLRYVSLREIPMANREFYFRDGINSSRILLEILNGNVLGTSRSEKTRRRGE